MCSFAVSYIDVYLTGSYGSTKRYKSVDRLIRINDRTVLGASGELSDLAYILKCALVSKRCGCFIIIIPTRASAIELCSMPRSGRPTWPTS